MRGPTSKGSVTCPVHPPPFLSGPRPSPVWYELNTGCCRKELERSRPPRRADTPGASDSAVKPGAAGRGAGGGRAGHVGGLTGGRGEGVCGKRGGHSMDRAHGRHCREAWAGTPACHTACPACPAHTACAQRAQHAPLPPLRMDSSWSTSARVVVSSKDTVTVEASSCTRGRL